MLVLIKHHQLMMIIINLFNLIIHIISLQSISLPLIWSVKLHLHGVDLLSLASPAQFQKRFLQLVWLPLTPLAVILKSNITIYMVLKRSLSTLDSVIRTQLLDALLPRNGLNMFFLHHSTTRIPANLQFLKQIRVSSYSVILQQICTLHVSCEYAYIP